MAQLIKWLKRFRPRSDETLNASSRAPAVEELNRSFLRMHELLGIDKDQVPDVREMSDLEFEDYIARLRRSKRLHVEL